MFYILKLTVKKILHKKLFFISLQLSLKKTIINKVRDEGKSYKNVLLENTLMEIIIKINKRISQKKCLFSSKSKLLKIKFFSSRFLIQKHYLVTLIPGLNLLSSSSVNKYKKMRKVFLFHFLFIIFSLLSHRSFFIILWENMKMRENQLSNKQGKNNKHFYCHILIYNRKQGKRTNEIKIMTRKTHENLSIEKN